MLLRNKKFLFGIIIILVLVVIAIISNALTTPTLRRTGSFLPNQPPGTGAPLGTDGLGRSIAIQMSEAIIKSLLVGLIAATLGTFLGALIGFASGYFGGIVDTLLRVLVDVFLSVPSLLFLILIASLVKGVRVQTMALIIGAFAWAWPARQVRAQVLSLKERAFVQIARLSGM
ncbi:MAG: ABC transporter permease, partial [Chloroflexi bacterium]|nr:ABC transporter permease [Chloroflexota bacterium]